MFRECLWNKPQQILHWPKLWEQSFHQPSVETHSNMKNKNKTKQNKKPQNNKTGVFTLRNNCFWVSMEASATHLSFLDCAKSVQLPIHFSEPLVVRDVHVHLMCVTFQAWFFQCLVNVSTTFRVATPCGLWNCSNELHVSLPVCIRKKNWTWEQKWSQFA